MTDLFSVDRLLEAGVFAHMLEPILDDEDDEGISDDEGLFTLTDQTPTAGTSTTPRLFSTYSASLIDRRLHHRSMYREPGQEESRAYLERGDHREGLPGTAEAAQGRATAPSSGRTGAFRAQTTCFLPSEFSQLTLLIVWLQGRLLEDGQRELKRLRVDSFLDDSSTPPVAPLIFLITANQPLQHN
jgi:hypothetical protein